MQFCGHPTPPSAQCVVLGAIVVESSCFCCCQNIPLFSRYWFNPRRIRRVSLIPYTWLFCSRRWSAVSSFSPPVGFVLAATPRVFLCPFPRMLFGDPRIVFIVIPSFLCNSVQSVVTPHPLSPNVLFWAQLLLNQVVYVVVKT